jgi:beta-lactamase superfamily II metal-dependent hydrolase
MTPIADEDLVIHVLNVGFGDTTIIEFPAEPDIDDQACMVRSYGLVDCRNAGKTRDYLLALAERRPATTELKFLCATHPHADHISGIRAMILDESFTPREFWDSGFHHASQSYRGVLMALKERNVPLARVSSGMEQSYGTVQVTALAPSMTLRNPSGGYQVDINNASIVLRLENRGSDAPETRMNDDLSRANAEQIREAGKSAMILGSDAELESWAQITKEISPVYLLACRALKVAHHGTMHSSALDVYQRMCPALAIISTKQEREAKPSLSPTRKPCPHPATQLALEELGTKLLTTDGGADKPTTRRTRPEPENTREGSVVVVIPPGGMARWRKLDDREDQVPEVVDVV